MNSAWLYTKIEHLDNEIDNDSLISALIEKILDFAALTTTHQEIVTFLLVTSENIIEDQRHLKECNSISITKTAICSLKRCLYQKPEDSELKQRSLHLDHRKI